jgi:hypothetical protein
MQKNEMPKVQVALLCDDVRREVNGKEIIIGVYSEHVYITAFPAMIVVTLYMKVTLAKSNIKYPIEFRVINASGNHLVPVGKLMLETINAAYSSSVIFGPIPLQIQSPGIISFQLRPDGSDDWSTIITLDVTQAPQGGAVPPPGEIIIQKMTIA